MTIEQRAIKAYEENQELKQKYQIEDEAWMDWYTKGYKESECVYKDQIESLKAALIAKDETHKIRIHELKEKALRAFLVCEGYDELERKIDSQQ